MSSIERPWLVVASVERLALLNDLQAYELTNAIIEEAVKDKEKSRL